MILGKTTDTGKDVKIDINKILESRMLLQANSGGGKSYAIRKFAEITHGKAQQIIIDVEGEFASLRDKFEYILVSKEGDIPISLRAAELLARRLLELNVSAIIDLYELKHHERIRFVKLFLDSMINSPKDLWHPCLVILDEAHIFAPEKGSGEAESSEAVKDMATRGRKRGFALVAATQRLSKLNKDVAAELNTKLIGRSSLDVDMKRAASELGFTNKDDIFSLRTMAKGEFFAFGPALSDTVTKIKISPVLTEHGNQPSNMTTPSKPTGKILQILGKLADLPQEAEKEIKSREELQRQLTEAKNKFLQLQKEHLNSQPRPEDVANAKSQGYQEAKREFTATLKKIDIILSECQTIFKRVGNIGAELTNMSDVIEDLQEHRGNLTMAHINPKPPGILAKVPDKIVKKFDESIAKTQRLETITEGPVNLSPYQRRVLTGVVQRPEHRGTKKQIAVLCGYSITSSSFSNCLGFLRSSGFIQYDGKDVVATESGISEIGNYEPMPTDHESLKKVWASKLSPYQYNILDKVCEVYPDSITKEELAAKTGYSTISSSFTNALGHLRSTGLIDYQQNKNVIATTELFPEVLI